MYRSITFIYPPYSNIYSDHSFQAFLPQLGILELLNSIKDLDIESKYIDVQCEERIHGSSITTFLNIDRLGSNDIIGFYTQTSMMPWISNAINTIKKTDPRITIIGGGPYLSGVFEGKYTSLAKRKCRSLFDYILIGESEKTLRSFLTKKANSHSIFKSERLSGDSLKFPLWEKAEKYLEFYKPAPNWIKNNPQKSLPILFSRGCKRACSFCLAKTIWKSRIVEKNTELISSEIPNFIKSYGLDHLQIWDDDFFLLEKSDQISEIVFSNGKSYSVNTAPNEINKERVKSLQFTNCTNVLLGVESLDSSIQDHIRKRVNINNLLQACQLLKSADIKVTLSFIIGFPNETMESIQKIKDFLTNHKDLYDYVLLNILSLHPGTRCYEFVLKNGQFKESELIPNTARIGEPYSLPTTSIFNRETLQQLQKDIYTNFNK